MLFGVRGLDNSVVQLSGFRNVEFVTSHAEISLERKKLTTIEYTHVVAVALTPG